MNKYSSEQIGQDALDIILNRDINGQCNERGLIERIEMTVHYRNVVTEFEKQCPGNVLKFAVDSEWSDNELEEYDCEYERELMNELIVAQHDERSAARKVQTLQDKIDALIIPTSPIYVPNIESEESEEEEPVTPPRKMLATKAATHDDPPRSGPRTKMCATRLREEECQTNKKTKQ